jgi:hypothetical protein
MDQSPRGPPPIGLRRPLGALLAIAIVPRYSRCYPSFSALFVLLGEGRDVALDHSAVWQCVGPEQTGDDRLRHESSDRERDAVRFEQVERDALAVEGMLEFVSQDDGDGSRVLAQQAFADRQPAHARIVVAGRSPWQIRHHQRQSQRRWQLGEVLAELPVGRVAGADLGKQAERLGQA